MSEPLPGTVVVRGPMIQLHWGENRVVWYRARTIDAVWTDPDGSTQVSFEGSNGAILRVNHTEEQVVNALRRAEVEL